MSVRENSICSRPAAMLKPANARGVLSRADLVVIRMTNARSCTDIRDLTQLLKPGSTIVITHSGIHRLIGQAVRFMIAFSAHVFNAEPLQIANQRQRPFVQWPQTRVADLVSTSYLKNQQFRIAVNVK